MQVSVNQTKAKIMVRKTATQEPSCRQSDDRSTKARRVTPSTTSHGLRVSPDQAVPTAKMKARLKSAAKEAFQLMGED
jgi:hypothetical protein